jgi:hypothetical protein
LEDGCITYEYRLVIISEERSKFRNEPFTQCTAKEVFSLHFFVNASL